MMKMVTLEDILKENLEDILKEKNKKEEVEV